MIKSFISKNKFLIPLLLLNIALLIAVVFYINHAQALLTSDVKITLNEVVTQNKDIITSRIEIDINKINAIADKITDGLKRQNITGHEDIHKALIEYAEQESDPNIFIADEDGLTTVKGKLLDISARKYFRLALSGVPNISDQTISRLNGEDIFVISVPLKYNNQVIGTIQKYYTAPQMYELFSLSLFSSKAYVYVINKEGYIILHTTHWQCAEKSDNFFRNLYENGNKEASEQIRYDVQNEKGGFLETTDGSDGSNIYSVYTPVYNVHDWYLITSVPTTAISPNGQRVLTLFFFTLSALTFVFTSSIAYFQHYKNQQKAALEKIAFVDPVTEGNTFNKFLVDTELILHNNLDKNFWVLKFDIDNFKYINNFYGFDFGDKILKQISNCITAGLQKNEVMARMSSDNFVVLLADASPERLESMLSFVDATEDVTVYFSAGIYEVRNHQENINLMVDKAGTASQTVKGSLNKKISYYSLEFDKQTQNNEQMKRMVKQAITDRRFYPYYQPKIDIYTGQLVGAEALARMFDKEGNMVCPAQFIPISEKTGLVLDVDMIIFEKVLDFLQKSLQQGVNCVPISINFSRIHLTDAKFIEKIHSKLVAHGVPAHLIEIELTESAIFDNVGAIHEITSKLRERGFLIAMDDFGSGYSSLNMLKDIPIDVLKVDKGFLDEAEDNNRRNIIFSSIADMAKKLNIKIVVEGVEFLENVELMKQCGCTIAQGYYFARPMNEEAFDKIFKDGTI